MWLEQSKCDGYANWPAPGYFFAFFFPAAFFLGEAAFFAVFSAVAFTAFLPPKAASQPVAYF